MIDLIFGILIGIVVGVLGLLALAVKLADHKEPEAADTRIAATSVSMNGNSAEQTLHDLTRIFREQPSGKA